MLCPSATWNVSSARAQENIWNQVPCAVHKDADVEQQVTGKDQRAQSEPTGLSDWICCPVNGLSFLPFVSALSLSKDPCTCPSQITMLGFFFSLFRLTVFLSTETEQHEHFLSSLCSFTGLYLMFKIITIKNYSSFSHTRFHFSALNINNWTLKSPQNY